MSEMGGWNESLICKLVPCDPSLAPSLPALPRYSALRHCCGRQTALDKLAHPMSLPHSLPPSLPYLDIAPCDVAVGSAELSGGVLQLLDGLQGFGAVAFGVLHEGDVDWKEGGREGGREG